MRTISVTEIRTYLRCREEHRLAYVEGYRLRRQAHDLRFGTVVHEGLATWWRTGSLHASLASIREAAETEGLDAYETARAEVMLVGYDARWEPDQHAIETLHVEQPFRLQRHGHAEPFALGGKIDAAARRGERRSVVEHKTTDSEIGPGSDYLARLTIDSQISLYAVASRELGLEPDVCLYDVLRKPGIEPKKATPIESRKYTKAGALYANQREHDETVEEFRQRLVEEIAEKPENYYARVEVVRLEHELVAALAAFDEIGAEIVDAYDRDRPAIKNADACRRFGRTCEYFGACTGSEELPNERFVQINRRG